MDGGGQLSFQGPVAPRRSPWLLGQFHRLVFKVLTSRTDLPTFAPLCLSVRVFPSRGSGRCPDPLTAEAEDEQADREVSVTSSSCA